MTINEKAAYIKGLADGLKLNEETTEGKILGELLKLVADITAEISEIKEDAEQLREYVEELDQDLGSVEEDLYETDDEEEEDDEFDPSFYEVTCPECGETICFDESMDLDELTCPNCGEKFGCDACDCDGVCEGCSGCMEDADEE